MSTPLPRVIIVGVDGSDISKAAAVYAAGIARDLKVPLELVWVRQPVVLPPIEVYSDTIARLETGEQQLAEKNLATIAGANPLLADARRVVLIGSVVEQLASYAEARKASMIVVGSRGQGAFARAALGSVSTGLVHTAQVPVLVFHPV